jgi:hypothetical protein
MGCRCGQSARVREMISTRNSGSAGAYPLFTYSGCDTLYKGQFEGMSIYVVARGTSEEKLFPKGQLVQAAEYARSLPSNVAIENLPTASLCSRAVTDVYG